MNNIDERINQRVKEELDKPESERLPHIEVSKELHKELNGQISYDKLRKRVGRRFADPSIINIKAKSIVKSPVKEEVSIPDTSNLSDDEVEILREYRGVKEVAKLTNAPIEDIDFYWDKTQRYSTKVQNRFYKPRGEQSIAEEINFDTIFKNKITPVEVKKQSPKEGLFDRAVYTDVHIGMTPNKDGYSLYGGKWDEEEVNERLEEFANRILLEQKSNTLYLDELGDFMDGWDGQTVRKGHDLPQNMDNQKAYDVGLSFKVRLIDTLIQHYDKIICHNVCEDNHAGAFGYVVNSAFKTIMSYKYPHNVEVYNIRKFIGHYSVGKYVFILTHGKDGKNLKFGFKPVIDPKQIEKISNYIDENFLYTKDCVIEFSKGDSHQWLFDNSSSDRFNYYNYPAFSPSSEWVQTNFKKGISGFIIFNYFADSHKATHEHLFSWKSADVYSRSLY